MTYPIAAIKDYCLEHLDFDSPHLHFAQYSCVPLCAVAMIFSVGVVNNIVHTTIARTCKYLAIPQCDNATISHPPKAEQMSVSQFLAKINGLSPDELATKVFGNKLTTSARNGILKAEAALQFLKILQKYQIEYFEDVPKICLNPAFDEDFKKVKGQSSGLGLRHFLMLTTPPHFVRPDKTTARFLFLITEQKYALEACTDILMQLTAALQTEYATLTPQQLDYLIFHYQKSRNLHF